jgi:hypothetical protein
LEPVRQLDRNGGDHQVNSPNGEDQAEQASRDPEHHALGQQAAHNLPAAGAERAADGDFLGAGSGARQKEISHIRTGNEMDENDRAHDKERELLAVVSDHLLPKVLYPDVHSRIRRRMIGGEPSREAFELSARFLD